MEYVPRFLKVKTLKNVQNGATLEYVDKKPVVACLVLNGNREGLFVRQYRAGSQSIALEVVAGSIEAGQTPEDAVYAELLQEVGLKREYIAKLCPLGSFYSSIGWTNELAHLFVATTALDWDGVHASQMLDSDEHIDYEWISIDNLNGQFDAMSMATALILEKVKIEY